MDRSSRLQRNEQVKALSNLAGNSGLAFLAGRGPMVHLLDGIAIIAMGIIFLTQLQAET